MGVYSRVALLNIEAGLVAFAGFGQSVLPVITRDKTT